MDNSQLTQVLINCTNPDQNIRQMAEKWLQEAEKANIALFLQMLAHELSNNDKPGESRRLAGLIVKNSLTAKDENRKIQLVQKWVNLDINIRTSIKTAVLMTLSASNRDARSTAAQVVAAVAHIELPRHLWPDLVQVLLTNMQQENDHLKQATLEAIGYICEEIESEVLTAQANSILTAICKGMKEGNNEVKLAACNALFNCLEFVRANFEKDVERHYIMQVTCDTAASTDLSVRVASFECLVKIASLYYDKLGAYMQKLFNLTLEAIKKDDDQVALQSVEFWSTICDEELYLLEEAEEAAELKIQPSRQSQNFIRGALKFLVPILTECLLKQEDDPDEDTWNVAMAAGTCLALVATVVGDDVVQFVVPFVQQHIAAENWKSREAATLAFGAILEGPKSFVPQLVAQALPVLIQHMKDPIVYVKDTTAWTIGRICQLHPQTVSPYLQNLITILVEALTDNSRVAANVCWAIHNLALAYEDDQEKQTSVLSHYFQGLLEKLLNCTIRDDSDESNLRTSAYEAINVLIQSGAQDTHQVIMNATPVFIDRLEKTFAMQIVSQDDREEQNELQSLLCGVIQVIIQKMGENIKTFSDKMMSLFLQVFSVKSASVHEEALMAVGALANAVESDFEKYMAHFRPFLTMGLKNYEEHQVCAVAVGVVGDISRALLNHMVPYCDEIVSMLLQDLQNPLLNRSVKPPILSCFGDIALAIGGEFVKYLGVVMSMLQQASATSVDSNDFDLVDYLNQLRESIFEAYTGIIQGLRGDNAGDHFLPFVSHVVSFVGFVFQDKSRSDAVTRGALGVLGDLAHALGPKVKQQLQQPFVKQLIGQCLQSDSSQTREVAQWAKEVLTKL